MPTPLLSDASNDELVSEITKRAGLVASIWNIDDVISLIADDDDAADLTEEQIRDAAFEFLTEIGRGLQDVLAQRGNEYTSDRWNDTKAAIIARITSAAAAPR